MKRILGILAVVALVAMTVKAVEVKSENVAGVVTKSVAVGQLALIGVSIDDFAGEPTLESLFDEAVAAANYLVADQVLVFDAGAAQYNRWAKYDGDGLWYRCNDNAEWNAGTVQTNLTLPVGSAVWFRCNPSQAQDLVLTGQAVESSSVSMGLIQGLQMIAYPFSSQINLDDSDFAGDGATQNANYLSADQVIFWNGSAYQRYALYTDGKWYGANDNDEWNAGTVLGSDKDIALGEGFWYRAQNVAGLTWTEDNPYLANL
ncbi:MAG: hypothetical protein QGH42_07575 [Kiritimatiellia bacterium]|jgi:hypothetical protein|nr:hypothetical protein [Kiritimatiellia bacterium]MDP7024083.1 hypothetical protein [Kiritimatiellia bacterium]